MGRKIILILIILSLFSVANYGLAICSSDNDCQKVERGGERTVKCVNGKCVRALEVVYPNIGGVELPPYTSGIPQYVKYIFHFAVAILGIVIFGALVYNSFLYLISAGNPAKLEEAKSGILSAFLGAIILLSSVLLFNQINPQLTKIDLNPPPLVGQRVIPGIYVCNYKVNDIGAVLNDYLTPGDKEKQIEAVKKLQKYMWDSQTQRACPRLNFSGNFKNFSVTADGNTIFIIPTIEESPDGKKRKFKWEYGVIFHELENQKGKIDYFPKENGDDKIFIESESPGDDPMKKNNYLPAGLPFIAHSFTVFKKPSEEVEGEGVKVYKEFNYCKDLPADKECKEIDVNPGESDIIKETNVGELENEARSISFHPEGGYLAILFPDKEFKDKGLMLTKNTPDLVSAGIPMSEACGGWLFWWYKYILGQDCKPLFGSIIVIKGNKL